MGPDRQNPFPVVRNSDKQGSTISAELPAQSAHWDSEDGEIQAGQGQPRSSPTLCKDDGIMNFFGYISEPTLNFKGNLNIC